MTTFSSNNDRSKISTKHLKFNPPHKCSFTVTVFNQTQDYASFYLKLYIPGLNHNNANQWSKIEPGVTNSIPPRDHTPFTVEINNNPIDNSLPGINRYTLMVEVWSDNSGFPNPYDRHRLDLEVRQQQNKQSQLQLTTQDHSGYPGHSVIIQVRAIMNNILNPQDIILKLYGEQKWLQADLYPLGNRSANTPNIIDFSGSVKLPTKISAGNYPFTIQAYFIDSREVTNINTIQDSLRIFSHSYGQVSFQSQRVSANVGKKILQNLFGTCQSIKYKLTFTNQSNSLQTIDCILQGNKGNKYKLIWDNEEPSNIIIHQGSSKSLDLTIKNKAKYWWLWYQKIELEAKGSSKSSVTVNPEIQQLKGKFYPILPWLSKLLLIIPLLLLLLWLLPPQGHTEQVTTVSFNGIGNLVLSGSFDQTVRSWQVRENHVLCKWLPRTCFKYQGIVVNSQKNDSKRVKVLKFRPEDNNKIAIGLENKGILLWDLNRKTIIRELEDSGIDDVFALRFSKDSQYLFSGHGRFLRMWSLTSETPPLKKDVGFAINSLVLDESQKTLIVAGQYSKIMLGNWIEKTELPQFSEMNYPENSKNHYIYSLAITQENILVTSDSRGRLILWDLNRCEKSANLTKCYNTDVWPREKPTKIPAFSIALSQEGDYLVAGREDGKIILWHLDKQGNELKFGPEEIIMEYSSPVMSVDIINKGDNLLIVSGLRNNQVKLTIYSK